MENPNQDIAETPAASLLIHICRSCGRLTKGVAMAIMNMNLS